MMQDIQPRQDHLEAKNSKPCLSCLYSMGKTRKKERKLHTNHHDSPASKTKKIVRRNHSQVVPKKSASAPRGPPRGLSVRARYRVPFVKHDHILCVGEGAFSVLFLTVSCSILSNAICASPLVHRKPLRYGRQVFEHRTSVFLLVLSKFGLTGHYR